MRAFRGQTPCRSVGKQGLYGQRRPLRSTSYETLFRRPRSQHRRSVLVWAARKPKTVQEPLTAVTAPIQVTVEKQLSPVERLQMAPFWSTFCGTSNGAWQGVQAAFSPLTGEAEAVALDSTGDEVMDVRTITLEARELEDGDDRVLRRTLRATSAQGLRDQAAEANGNGDSDTKVGEQWEVETISSEEEGLVFFDGGTYSRGPPSLLPADISSHDGDGGGESAGDGGADLLDADKDRLERQLTLQVSTSEEEEDPIRAEADVGEDPNLEKGVCLLEQCLAWGGEQRLRLRLTIVTSPGEEEMEVDVLRIALLKESWQCLADDESPSCVADPASEAFPPLSAQPRSRPRELKGEWKVFDVTAVPLPDDAALDGEPQTILVYFSSETQQAWREDRGDPGDQGAAFWLPGNAVVELMMVPPTSRGTDGDAQEGMELEGQGRGLCISFSWLVNERTLIGLQREYDAMGELKEVRSRTAVKGGWVGGRM